MILPASWNQRAAQMGGGGINGVIPNLTGGEFGARGPTLLQRSVATYSSDMAGDVPLRRSRPPRSALDRRSYDDIEREIRRLLVAAHSESQLPTVTELAAAFAKTGQPSYTGITNETYIGAERGASGAVTLKGDWHTDRQYVELKKGSGEIVMPFVGGEANLVMQPGPSGRAAVIVLLDGKPVGEARGMDVDTDGVARLCVHVRSLRTFASTCTRRGRSVRDPWP